MIFISEPAYWMLLAASLSACCAAAFMQRICRIRGAALLSVFAGASGTTWLLFGPIAAIISASFSAAIGLVLLIASLVRSGIRSMPNSRFEER